MACRPRRTRFQANLSWAARPIRILSNKKPQPREEATVAGLVSVHRPEPLLQKAPIDRLPHLHQPCFITIFGQAVSGTDPTRWSSVARVVASQVLAPSAQNHGSDSRESLKLNLQANISPSPKSGKFDYSCAPSHSAQRQMALRA
jgi:hypothetical protein